MKPPSKTEPTAIIVSMALTALAASFIDSLGLTWKTTFIYLIFFLSGASATQLYWSLIVPLVREQLDGALNRRKNNRLEFFVQLVSYYLRVTVQFVFARCTLEEMRLLGYLNGLAAFLLLFLGQLFNIYQFSDLFKD